MKAQTDNSLQIRSEKRNFSKYLGLLVSRILLLLELFLLLFVTLPTPAYLLVFLVLFPWIYSNLSVCQKENAVPLCLSSLADTLFYTPARYKSEHITGNIAMFFLIVWQLSLNRYSDLAVFLHLAPSLCLLSYWIIRILTTLIAQRKINSYYTDFHSLEQ